MKVLVKIIKKEMLLAFRARLLVSLGIAVLLLLAVAFATGYQNYAQQRDQIERAQHEKNEQWLAQGDKHPHIAAHYGTFVFKPKTMLSFFDFGLDAYTGTSIYLEAHYQHEFMFRPAQDYSSMIRFGEFSPALVLQVLFPLLIIFMCFAAFTSEKENGTLRLLISQGLSVSSLVWGKIIAYTILIFLELIPLCIAAVIYISVLPGQEWSTDMAGRMSLVFFAYFMYLVLYVGISVVVSYYSSTSRNSLLTLLIVWLAFTVVMPKAAANFGDSLYKLPATKEFREAISRDIVEGMEGISREERMANLEREYLLRYGVDSVEKLSFNFEAVSMQRNEDYANESYDVHWNKMNAIITKQNQIGRYLSFVNPYLAIQNISMSLSGTDVNTAVDFQRHVEAYRRNLIRKMNHDMEVNSKFGEFYEYKAGIDLWREIKNFTYQIPGIHVAMTDSFIEIIALCGWFIAFIIVLFKLK